MMFLCGVCWLWLVYFDGGLVVDVFVDFVGFEVEYYGYGCY